MYREGDSSKLYLITPYQAQRLSYNRESKTMIQLTNKDGQPIQFNVRSLVLAAVIGLGVLTLGAEFPGLSPLGLIEMGCGNG